MTTTDPRTARPMSWFQRLLAWLRGDRPSHAELIAQHWEPRPTPPEPNLRLQLPSADPEFPFHVALTVEYRDNTGTPQDSLAIAKGAISWRAQQITSTIPLTEVERCHAELTMALADRWQVGQTGVIASARCLDVTADDDHRHAIASRQDSLRRARMREWQWEDDEHQINHLAELITDPRRATAWWLLRHQDDIEQLNQTAGQFCQLRDLLHRTEQTTSANATDSVGHIVEDFYAQAEPMATERLTVMITRLFQAHGSDTLAARLQVLAARGESG